MNNAQRQILQALAAQETALTREQLIRVLRGIRNLDEKLRVLIEGNYVVESNVDQKVMLCLTEKAKKALK